MIEAKCEKCGDTFNPLDESDLEHCVRNDGETECGGTGRILGGWYASAVAAAVHDQGLDALRDIPGVVMEQTGGFTMVAMVHRADGGSTGITWEGDGYFVCDYPDAESEGSIVGEEWSIDAVRSYLAPSAAVQS